MEILEDERLFNLSEAAITAVQNLELYLGDLHPGFNALDAFIQEILVPIGANGTRFTQEALLLGRLSNTIRVALQKL